MCVIAYIPKEAKEVSRRELLAMWESNPDGAGMMWLQNNHVHFSKGYFSFDEFYRDYLVIKRDYNYECAVHFRIATSGGINPSMCHPFIVTDSVAKIVKIKGHAECCVMHNGIIPINNRPYLSDTAEYIIDCLYPQYKKDKTFFLHLTKRQEFLLQNEIGRSKLLFFSDKGVKMFGAWQKHKDYYCSNLNFTWRLEKPSQSYYTPTKTYNSYYDYLVSNAPTEDDNAY